MVIVVKSNETGKPVQFWAVQCNKVVYYPPNGKNHAYLLYDGLLQKENKIILNPWVNYKVFSDGSELFFGSGEAVSW